MQGVGYVNELLARLTDSPVRDHTQHNASLPFPLHKKLYADFSHDNQMIAIYAALGLFPQRAPLDPTAPDPKRTYVASRLVPFSGRLVTERLECGAKGKFVRMLVDDALQPLEFCGGDKDGLCALERFVVSQSYSRNNGEGDFEKCFD